MRCITLSLLALAAALTLAGPAGASQLIDRNATHVTMTVNSKGEAMLTYSAGGTLKHVLAWGATGASAPTKAHPQVKFSLDYSGGYGKYHQKTYWLAFNGSCLHYDGPALPWLITACKSTDGSYWALQSWQRGLPDYGVTPNSAQSARELRLSHWIGAAPVLTIATDWSYHKYDHLFGTFTYGGIPVYGFKSTAAGVPLDTYGRNIYVDALDSDYGQGWRRVNSFLTHNPKGSFCYGFYPHGSHGTGKGTQYRATAEGPGVAPDVVWTGLAPGTYDKATDTTANDALKALGDPKCKAN